MTEIKAFSLLKGNGFLWKENETNRSLSGNHFKPNKMERKATLDEHVD
jgi:hypothetical protein